MVMRPFAFCTRTGLVTLTFVVVLVLDGETVASEVVLVRVALLGATVGDPEMLAGGLTTEAAVGDSVRTLAKAAGAEMALLVGVTAVPEGAITGAAAFVTSVVPDEPMTVDAAVDPPVPMTTPDGLTMVPDASIGNGSPAPLVITSVGPE